MILILGDIHAGNRRPFSCILEDGLNSRFVDTLQILRHVAGFAKKGGISHMILLGDIFETPGETLPKDVLIYIKNMLLRLADSVEDRLLILSGNHDLHRGKSILTTFEDIPKIDIITSPVWVNVAGNDCLFIPYHRDISTVSQWLIDCATGRKYDANQYLFAHVEVKGLTVGRVDYQTRIGIDLKQLPNIFGYKFLGHIHKPMDIGNVVVVGSILQNKTDEEGDQKRMVLLDDGMYRSVGLHGPQFHTIEITDSTLFDDNGKDYYTLILKKPGLEDTLPRGYRFRLVHAYKTERKERLQAKPTDTLDTLLIKYLDGLETKLNKEELTKLSLQAWQEAE